MPYFSNFKHLKMSKVLIIVKRERSLPWGICGRGQGGESTEQQGTETIRRILSGMERAGDGGKKSQAPTFAGCVTKLQHKTIFRKEK